MSQQNDPYQNYDNHAGSRPGAGADYQPPQYRTQPQQPQPPYYQSTFPCYPPPGYLQKSRLAAALLALILGIFGVHNFYLDQKVRGVIHILLCIFLITLPISAIWAFIESIQLFIGGDHHNYDGNGVYLRE